MKHLIAFLSILFIPTFVWGDMVGYSGDTRRYVTNAEKAQSPYNSVVRIVNGNNVGTGTFISKDVILTCKNVVNGIGLENDVKYNTPGGTQRTGYIAVYPEGNIKSKDYAVIVSKNSFKGNALPLSLSSKQSDNLMVIGYDNLKPLSNDELRIVRHLYGMWLSEHEDLTTQNSQQAMRDVDARLKKDYACSSDTKENCVRCSNKSGYCIFDDNFNMKVRTGCKINYIGDQLYTNCPLSPGGIGAAIIDTDTKKIIGILCEIRRPQVAQEKEALTLGTKPESYIKETETTVDFMKYDDDDEY